MQRKITRGAAANAGLIFHVFAQDSTSTSGAGKASVAFSSFTCYYIRNGEAISGAITPQDITTIGTYAAPTANTNIRIKAVDNTNMIGIYEVQIHLDWVNTTNSCQSLTIFLSAAGVAVLPIQIPLVAFDMQTATQKVDLDTIKTQAVTAAAGVTFPTSIASPTNITSATGIDVTKLLGTAWLTPAVAGTPDVNAKQLGGAPVTATTSVTFPAASTVATTTGAVGSVTGAVGSVTGLTASDVGAIKTKTDFLPSATAGNAGGVFIAGSNAATTTAGLTTGALATGTITTTGNLSVSGTTTLTGAVSMPAGLAANITGNITGTLSTVTTLTNLPAITSNWLTAAGTAADFGAEVADAVWDEAIAGHLGAGSTGLALNSAGAAGDPWSTALPGAYGAGTAGKIVGDNVNATISSRAATIDATERNAIADALLDRNMATGVDSGSTTVRTPRQALRALRNKWTNAGGTYTVHKEDDASASFSTALGTDAAAVPIVSSDPAGP